jgi:hypothetical protein
VSYSWSYSVLKRAEGGPGTADAVAAVKAAKLKGVAAFREQSPYVGHESIRLHATTKRSMRQALGLLRRTGFVNGNVADILRWECEPSCKT